MAILAAVGFWLFKYIGNADAGEAEAAALTSRPTDTAAVPPKRPEDEILGKWELSDLTDTYTLEFSENGSVFLSLNGCELVGGAYSMTGNRLTLLAEVCGVLTKPFPRNVGPDYYPGSISFEYEAVARSLCKYITDFRPGRTIREHRNGIPTLSPRSGGRAIWRIITRKPSYPRRI